MSRVHQRLKQVSRPAPAAPAGADDDAGDGLSTEALASRIRAQPGKAIPRSLVSDAARPAATDSPRAAALTPVEKARRIAAGIQQLAAENRRLREQLEAARAELATLRAAKPAART